MRARPLVACLVLTACFPSGDDTNNDAIATSGGDDPSREYDRCPEGSSSPLAELAAVVTLVAETDELYWQYQALAVDGDDLLAGLVVLREGQAGGLVRFSGGAGPPVAVAPFPTVARITTITSLGGEVHVKAVRGGSEGYVWRLDGDVWTERYSGPMNGFDPMLAHPDWLVVRDGVGNIVRIPRDGGPPQPTDEYAEAIGPAGDDLLLVRTVASGDGPWQQRIDRMPLATGKRLAGEPRFCLDPSIVPGYRALLERDGVVWFNSGLAVATIGPQGHNDLLRPGKGMRDLQATDDAVYFLDEYAGPQDVAVYRIRFADEVPEVVARVPAEGRSITGFAAGPGVVFVALGDGWNTGRLWRADLP